MPTCTKNSQPQVYQGKAISYIKMAAINLTEKLFNAIQGLSYSESMKYISPGSGLHASMFDSLEYSQH